MIPHAYITEWRSKAPWKTNEQVEQDLILSHCLVEIFSDSLLKQVLAFRGGTAIHKLFVPLPLRYSEDIDLVQTQPTPIGPVFDAIRARLAFLGKARIQQKDRNNTLTFKTLSTIAPVAPIKIKVEINCREHMTTHGLITKSYCVESPWYNGRCDITTYRLDELLGSKLRALYQRKKGRDLFDIWYCMMNNDISIPGVTASFHAYMQHVGARVSAKAYCANMDAKLLDTEFRNDTIALLSPNAGFDIDAAWKTVRENLIEKLDTY
jgi:predicted nucleotidyltransferase component of viral defense system